MRNETHKHDGNDSVTPHQPMMVLPSGGMLPAKPCDGMSTREYFFGVALGHLVAQGVDPREAAARAVAYADESLLALAEDQFPQ